MIRPAKPDLGSSQKPAGMILHTQDHADGLCRSFLTTERPPSRSLTSERKLLMTQSRRKTKASVLQCLYRDLAEALAIVSQHPAIPEQPARRLQRLAITIAPLAGLDVASLTAPRPGIEKFKANDLLLQLGLAMANALENPSVPVAIWDEISEEDREVEDLMRPKDPYLQEAARLRGVVIAYASVPDLKLADWPSAEIAL